MQFFHRDNDKQLQDMGSQRTYTESFHPHQREWYYFYNDSANIQHSDAQVQNKKLRNYDPQTRFAFESFPIAPSLNPNLPC